MFLYIRSSNLIRTIRSIVFVHVNNKFPMHTVCVSIPVVWGWFWLPSGSGTPSAPTYGGEFSRQGKASSGTSFWGEYAFGTLYKFCTLTVFIMNHFSTTRLLNFISIAGSIGCGYSLTCDCRWYSSSLEATGHMQTVVPGWLCLPPASWRVPGPE